MQGISFNPLILCKFYDSHAHSRNNVHATSLVLQYFSNSIFYFFEMIQEKL